MVGVSVEPTSSDTGATVAGAGSITSLLTTLTPAQATLTAPILATTHNAARAKDFMTRFWLTLPPRSLNGSLNQS
jgi:hypothetical protein